MADINWEHDLFQDRDYDGNEPDSSDEDSEDGKIPAPPNPLPEIVDEEPTSPAIQIEHTAQLRKNLEGQDLSAKVAYVLCVMDSVGINLPIFLDALSWGDKGCILDGKIRYERTALMTSVELPGKF
ncbi:hypothetical protein DXG03_004729 [Asterophora parasitica]|uniref:Uncharacterized protein n=1 Tax=Asterophora parasitica TaxID=117018 RepID=A0A9P7G8P0_9AGAR|nr:hypothetical protein DXG03_004729 [Asterophora parasitica]